MGGDSNQTCVRTSTPGGRRVLILKDSFGNALPGYLFFSFEEIHIVDNRYFTKNMSRYVREHRITDILFANNVFSAYNPNIGKKYIGFLTQADGVQAAPARSESKSPKTAGKQGKTNAADSAHAGVAPTALCRKRLLTDSGLLQCQTG